MYLPRGTFTGRYEVAGHPPEADSILIHSMGTEVGDYSVNRQLVIQGLYYAGQDRKLLVDPTLPAAFADYERRPDFIVSGKISNIVGGNLGVWGSFLQMKDYMDEHGLQRPLLVTEAHLVGRCAVQAVKAGLDPIVPGGLPRQFDRKSEQIWTRGLPLWAAHEIIGVPLLKRQGKM